MKVGLVHGRFQPLHNGHKFLIDKMLKECDMSVVLLGSVGKDSKKNPFSLEERKQIIREIYGDDKRLYIGANLDLDLPYSKDAQWDVVLSSCVLTLTGHLPTHIYVGSDYTVVWDRVKPVIRKFERLQKISGTEIRRLASERRFKVLEDMVPHEVVKHLRKKVDTKSIRSL